MNKLNLILYIVLFSSLVSCEYIRDLNRDGETITKEYEISSFSSLEILAPYKVILIQDTATSLEVEGLDYLLDDVEITQESSTLTLNHDSPSLISQSKLPTVRIHSPSFSSVTVDTEGELIADTLTQSSFTLHLLSHATYYDCDMVLNVSKLSVNVYYYDTIGTMDFSGAADYAYLWISGSTEINATDLKTQTMDFKMMSAVDCSVSVADQLNLKIYSSGDVLLYGNPTVTVDKLDNNVLEPTGELIYMDE